MRSSLELYIVEETGEYYQMENKEIPECGSPEFKKALAVVKKYEREVRDKSDNIIKAGLKMDDKK